MSDIRPLRLMVEAKNTENRLVRRLLATPSSDPGRPRVARALAAASGRVQRRVKRAQEHLAEGDYGK